MNELLRGSKENNIVLVKGSLIFPPGKSIRTFLQTEKSQWPHLSKIPSISFMSRPPLSPSVEVILKLLLLKLPPLATKLPPCVKGGGIVRFGAAVGLPAPGAREAPLEEPTMGTVGGAETGAGLAMGAFSTVTMPFSALMKFWSIMSSWAGVGSSGLRGFLESCGQTKVAWKIAGQVTT